MQTEKASPEWIQRHKEAIRLVETVRMLKNIYIYSSDELVKIVGERYRKVKKRRRGIAGRKELELKRLEVVYSTVYSRLHRIAKLPMSNELSSFHKALIESFLGDSYDKALMRVRRALKLIKEFWNEYKLLILSAQDAREAAKYRREGSGRILSVVRRLKRELEILKKAHHELLTTHVISEGLPVVIVAGIPSSGKSTLVKLVSTAEPEIAPYPFTTKTIIVGKAKYRDIMFYIVDTPGILERPSYMHNEVEKKAYAALKTLPNIIVYIFDPSEERVQDLDEQIKLLKDIFENVVSKRSAGLILVLNKIDLTTNINTFIEKIRNSIPEIFRYEKTCSENIIPISALHGTGVDALKEAIYACLRITAPWIFAK
ncbi:NOG1 family protein [Pyrofollis japonicus]|uniref:NOG1 family protein n=1 Tax=Pyrofollis japonicus TaxID=3060460 RepID=UPI00295AD25C|nr:GTPase [Pyrofollis japonicus]